jgi:glycosyltransferase involved in cell wall biosynthesis
VRVLLALTYYRPHISGLTIYVERLATALAARGHEVTVLTSQYDRALPREASEHGVRVVRVPVAFRVGKGVVMPSYGRVATRLVRSHDVLSIHVPQFDAAGLALRARLFRRPALLTYHCDLQLPPGLLNRVADRVVAGSNHAAAVLATRIVAYTNDYAESTPLLRRFREKVEVVPPPVVMPLPDSRAVEHFRRSHGILRPDGTRRPTIGMAARFAAEKGIDVLLAALPILKRRFPDLQVLFAGQYEDLLGEERYRARLAGGIEALGDRWRFLGPLDPAVEMPAFLAALDCLVVPSVNSTESFGLVQVEAMLCGTPVVASALPGVREVVRRTGMGASVPPGDSAALAEAVGHVLARPERYVRPRPEIERLYDLSVTVDRYEELLAADPLAAAVEARAAEARG